jgi:hypothetical protein
LFSKTRLKRKDFQEILRLPWAQEVPRNLSATAKDCGRPKNKLLNKVRVFYEL